MTDTEWWRTLGDKNLPATLGIEILELNDDRVVATMPVDARTHQPFGILHGGASVALAETVASLGATGRIDRDAYLAVGQEINANHLRAKSEGVVTATAIPLHVGRSSHVWSVDIRDEAGALVCVSRCTMAIVPKRRSASR